MDSTTRGGIDKYAVNHSKLSLTEECDSDLVRAKWAKNFDGVRFIELVRAIESASLNGSHTAQTDLVRVLIEHADMYKYSHELQRYALLKLLLPGMNGNTYGVKATGLICAWGGVMGQSGAQLARAYVKDPILCSNERNDVVVSCDIFATQLQVASGFVFGSSRGQGLTQVCGVFIGAVRFRDHRIGGCCESADCCGGGCVLSGSD